MSSPSQGHPVQGGSFGSGYTLPSRQLPVSDSLISKRVCFYKSGDYTFNGHRMVISVRTFKTFDALLDALSKKVPLAFGVRTITTPRGIHYVKGLDDLFDGGSYVCSDQKRVKPINLKEMRRRQVPWNTTRPVSARRRRQGVTIEAIVTERVAIRTPKRLEVIKNRDPSVKSTIILQKRTAPTFDALLDYLSQILQFPVLKLYSTEGQRVNGLATLILCSGVIVAAGNEPFRLGNYQFQRRGQMAQATLIETSEASIPQPQVYNKPLLNGKGSRNFSPSSERYIVDQINKSQYGNLHSGPVDPDTSIETCGNECHTSIVPQDEDIEKSFRVNQDGSMTVEMKVRLKIKEEEMLHWTTTLNRTGRSKGTSYPMVSGATDSSPDCNNTMAKTSVSEEEAKEANLPAEKRSNVGFIEKTVHNAPEAIKRKSTFRRAPTPGPKHVKMKEVKIDSDAQKVDQFTYMKRTSENDTTEEYHMVHHSSNRSNRPVPKPRKNTSNKGVAEVLQVEHNGFGVRERVMHIYENQGCCDAYFGNKECSEDSMPLDGSSPAARPAYDKRQSLSNDCDIDCSWQPPVVDPVQNEEILSLSSEPLSSSCRITNNLSSVTDNLGQTMPLREDTAKANKGDKKKKVKHARKEIYLTGSLDKKQDKVTRPAKNSKKTSSDKLSNKASFGKKSSIDIAKSDQKGKQTEKLQTKKIVVDKEKVSEITRSLTKSTNKVAPYNGHNVNVPDTKATTNNMKKSISDILKPNKSLPVSQKTISSKSKSVNKNARSPKKSQEVSESSAVIASVNPSPSEIHQYVENWLEKVSPEAVPYMDEDLKSHSKVEFQVGGDSEGEEKNHSRLYLEENCTSSESIKKFNSTLSVPLYQGGPMQGAVSMPTIRDISFQDVTIKSHKSAVAINCVMSTPKDKLQPILRQICSSVQCIHRASNTNTMPNIKKSTSLPDFPSQVASVFGSSCKAFLSFLSMMTLRDSLAGFVPSHGRSPRISSEAMLMMESLQKISTIDNEKKMRASLSDLQSHASAQLKEQWDDYQLKRGRSESELLSSKISESGMDILCQSGNLYGHQQLFISELMDELNMPANLRVEISSVIQEAIHFYPAGESVLTEMDQNQSEIGEEQIAKCKDVSELSSQDSELKERSQIQLVGMQESARGIDEGASVEDLETDGSLEEATSLTDQKSEEEDVEDENFDAKQVPEEVSEDTISVEDKEAMDSAVEDQECDLISEKNYMEVHEESGDLLEDSSSDIVQTGEVVCGEVKEEVSQFSDEEQHIDKDDGTGDAGENECGRESKTETTSTISEKGEQPNVGGLPGDATSKSVLEEALYLNHDNSCCDEGKSEKASLKKVPSTKSVSKHSSEDRCVDEKCNGIHSVSELETEEGESDCNLINPVEISQELLDYVNSALLSSSLIFTYDSLGNVKVAPNIKLTQETGKDSAYGFNCLPSPNTSELTDYRPESLESGGYKTQESLDIVTESEDSDKPFPVCRHLAQRTQEISNVKESLERMDSKLSHATCKSNSSFSSNDSGAKVSREDLSSFSTATSLKADNERAQETKQCISSVPGKHSPDGVLIDQGRWLLKENHLIRKSPPVSLGMYGHLDNTSIDTSLAEDSPSHFHTQANPLAALSSSELEEMARPITPKCTYYNMPHGSDSDPFLDDSSVKSGTNGVRDVKAERPVDTTRTWTNKNESLSSFASVEFKMQDRKVHPEGESSAVVQARRTSSGEQRVVQAEDYGETQQWRCHQYCPIL